MTLRAMLLAAILGAAAVARAGEPLREVTTAIFVMKIDGSEVRRLAQVEGYQQHGWPRWSHDGKRVLFEASQGPEGASHIYVVNADGTALARVGEHALADWSPDDKQVIANSHNGPGQKEGLWIQNLDGKGREFLTPGSAGRWSPDGAEIALVDGGTLTVLSLLDASRRKLFEQPPGEIRPGFAWSPDGKRLAFVAIPSAERPTLGELWVAGAADGSKGETARWAGLIHGGVSWSPDGKRLAIAMHDSIQTIEAEGREPSKAIPGQQGKNSMPAWSPDGQWIAFSSDRKTPALAPLARVRRAVTLEEVARHPRGVVVYQVAAFPDGRRVLLSGDSSTPNIQIWNIDTGETTQFDHLGPMVELSPDGKMIALTGSLTKIPLINSETGKVIRNLPLGDMCPSIRFSDDGTRLVSGAIGGVGIVWDIASGKEICYFKKHTKPITRAAFFPGGKEVATNGQDKTTRIWDAKTAEERLAIEHPDAVWGLAVSPDARLIATGTGGTTVGNPIAQRIEQGEENILRLWEASSGKLVREMKGHTNIVYAITFSPDGRTLVSGGWDGTIRVWDVESGEQQAMVQGQGSIYSLVFTPDGSRLVVGGGSNRSAGARLQSFRDEQVRLYRMVEGAGAKK